MISWTSTKADYTLINKIAARACDLFPMADRITIQMDVACVHSNGCPLRLHDLLGADDANFMHDIAGISQHLDRKTGKLAAGFRPRFAA